MNARPSSDEDLVKRAAIVGGLLTVGFVILALRLFQLHVLNDDLAKKAAIISVERIGLPAERGWIMDRHGEVIARNQTIYTLYADKHHLRDYNLALRALARAEKVHVKDIIRGASEAQVVERYRKHVIDVLVRDLGLDAAKLNAQLGGPGLGDVDLKASLTETDKRRIDEVFAEKVVRGLHFRGEGRRFHPDPVLLSQVAGYVADGTGHLGLEQEFDKILKGTDGFREVEVDNRGREIAAYRREEKLPVHGLNLRTTIDLGLQYEVEKVLDAAYARYSPDKLTAIVMNPVTGEILAMANRPHFDLSAQRGLHKNQAVSDQYEPGSTFKIVALGAAFERGLLRMDDTFPGYDGVLTENGITIKDDIAQGLMTPTSIMAKSSNIGVYQIANRMSRDEFYESIREFGFGSPTRVQLPNELAGQVKDPSKWDATTQGAMARGYAVAVTPLQMLNALCAVANGGDLMRPRIVQAIEDENGEVIRSTQREIIRKVLRPETARLVRQTLEAVVDSGTGDRAAIPGVRVGGKTGTAWKYSVKEKDYLSGHYVASFMGYLPAEAPSLAGIVIVDDPKNPDVSPYGGSAAAPLFREMMTKALTISGRF